MVIIAEADAIHFNTQIKNYHSMYNREKSTVVTNYSNTSLNYRF